MQTKTIRRLLLVFFLVTLLIIEKSFNFSFFWNLLISFWVSIIVLIIIDETIWYLKLKKSKEENDKEVS